MIDPKGRSPSGGAAILIPDMPTRLDLRGDRLPMESQLEGRPTRKGMAWGPISYLCRLRPICREFSRIFQPGLFEVRAGFGQGPTDPVARDPQLPGHRGHRAGRQPPTDLPQPLRHLGQGMLHRLSLF